MHFQGKELPIKLFSKYVCPIVTFDAPICSSRAAKLEFDCLDIDILITFSQYKLGKYQGHWYMRIAYDPDDRETSGIDFTPEELEELNSILLTLNDRIDV